LNKSNFSGLPPSSKFQFFSYKTTAQSNSIVSFELTPFSTHLAGKKMFIAKLTDKLMKQLI